MKKFLYAFLFAFAGGCFAPPSANADGVVLALSGGGTRGFAHIGVIEVLEEQNIPVAGIVGTSIGAVIGALNASGYRSGQLRDIVSEMDLPALLAENSTPMYVSTGDDRLAKMSTVPMLSYKRTERQGGAPGILAGDKLFQFYARLVAHVDTADFGGLAVPYAAVATDLRSGEKVVLRSGSLPSVMRASMSIPALFEPWEINGRLLVDGGLVSNLPVSTAKELFPGFPVIGIDVSDIPSRTKRPINTIIDVVDQSLTIVMRRSTVEEARGADLVIVPDVQEFPFLDGGGGDAVIQRGREAVLPYIEEIRALSGGAPALRSRSSASSRRIVVADVLVEGLSDELNGRLRKQFLHWVGKPFDPRGVESSAARLMTAPDIATVDYRLQEADGGKSVLVLNVRKRAELDLGISGYVTNLSPYRWLYLKGTARGVFHEMDSLRGVVRLGSQWGVDLTYATAPEPLNAWEFTLAAQNWELDTSGGGRNWDRYSFGGRHLFYAGRVRMGLGAAFEYLDGEGSSFGPTFFASYDTLDFPGDPTRGEEWRINAWWPNSGEILYRLTYFKPIQIGKMWRTYLRFGYAEGNLDRRGRGVYLGAAEELYTAAERPFEAERMVWANIAFRRVLKRGVWGVVAAEVFGGYGYAMDKNYEKIAAPWEVGLAISIPNNLINVRLAAIYGSEEFKIGFFLGVPIWDHYPIP